MKPIESTANNHFHWKIVILRRKAEFYNVDTVTDQKYDTNILYAFPLKSHFYNNFFCFFTMSYTILEIIFDLTYLILN